MGVAAFVLTRGQIWVFPMMQLPVPDLARRNLIHLVGQNQGRGSELFIVIRGHFNATAIKTDMIGIIHVLDGNVEAIEPGKQRERLPVDRAAVEGLLQQFGRLLDFDRILKALHRFMGEGGDLPRMFTTPLATPSLVTKVISRFRNCSVIGTRTVPFRSL